MQCKIFLSLALAAGIFLTGCGPASPGVAVKGLVTYDGQPIPKGRISFEPSSSTMHVAVVSAKIENGGYQLPADAGPAPGQYNVRIAGYDGAAPQPFEIDPADAPGVEFLGHPLFDEYVTLIEVADDDRSRDIVVPTTAGRR
ncbi:hypothetical protein [Blastopirellula marina]|uniref:Carboxypeptidase regulatory-like domain-containing protein n=1 Tax=Blastopirellula marina DSM 3645 TaxID=314230 RepID=A3ZLS6_9BACT|nr:hypothetical protein [Blastopirellula marina]EAQ82709.1 hypothetical protein DSM3645_09927 [Blastopirellula marina DSM 3645]